MIVKHARVLTELCLRIIKQCTIHIDVTAIYHQLLDSYDSSDTEVDVEVLPSGSRMLRSLPPRYLNSTSDWKSEAKTLFQAIWDSEDAVPFRTPVNTTKYTDYHRIIDDPMDLSTVKDKLFNEKYETPNDFYNDMRLIFQNSRTYNTNQRSRIYVMTVRLAATFEEHITKIIRHWKMAKRRNYNTSQNGKKSKSGTSASSESSAAASESSDNEELKNALKSVSDSSDDSEENTPLTRLQIRIPKMHPSEHEATSSSDNKSRIVKTVEDSEESHDSEDSYKPSRSRKRNKLSSTSFEESSSEESSSDDRPLSQVARHNGRNVKKRLNTSDIPKKKLKIDDSDASDEEKTDNYITSVSSRGRVRKLNPRVTALMKK